MEDEDDARLIRSATPVRRGRAFARRGERHRWRNRDLEGYSVAVPPGMYVPPQILPEPLLLNSETDSEDNAEVNFVEEEGQKQQFNGEKGEKIVNEKGQEEEEEEKGQKQKFNGEKVTKFVNEKGQEEKEKEKENENEKGQEEKENENENEKGEKLTAEEFSGEKFAKGPVTDGSPSQFVAPYDCSSV